jgi:hypothetical protein
MHGQQHWIQEAFLEGTHARDFMVRFHNFLVSFHNRQGRGPEFQNFVKIVLNPST